MRNDFGLGVTLVGDGDDDNIRSKHHCAVWEMPLSCLQWTVAAADPRADECLQQAARLHALSLSPGHHLIVVCRANTIYRRSDVATTPLEEIWLRQSVTCVAFPRANSTLYHRCRHWTTTATRHANVPNPRLDCISLDGHRPPGAKEKTDGTLQHIVETQRTMEVLWNRLFFT